MLDLLREGGGPMLFVVAFGALTLIAAVVFAARGDRRRVALIGWMGAATLLSIGGGICADLAAVGHHAVKRCLPEIPLPACLLTGFAESMAPGIVGFTLLSLAAMLTAVGMSRTSKAATTTAS
jgi:hypothetical protein